MIIDPERTAAYICSFCSQVSIRPISLFALNSAPMLGFVCSDKECGEECIAISKEKTKVNLKIECPVCGDIHCFTTPVSSFVSKPLLTYACPVSNVNIFFFGLRRQVETCLENNRETLETLARSALIYNMAAVIRELIASQHVSCRCGSHDTDCLMSESGLILSCNQCGAVMRIPPSKKIFEQIVTTRSITIDGD